MDHFNHPKTGCDYIHTSLTSPQSSLYSNYPSERWLAEKAILLIECNCNQIPSPSVMKDELIAKTCESKSAKKAARHCKFEMTGLEKDIVSGQNHTSGGNRTRDLSRVKAAS